MRERDLETEASKEVMLSVRTIEAEITRYYDKYLTAVIDKDRLLAGWYSRKIDELEAVLRDL